MIAGDREHPLVAFSVSIYWALLAFYPSRFRQEYGTHMLMVFRDCCLRAIRQGGMNGMAKLWAVTLLDLFLSLIEEHTRKETDMTRSKFIRLSGWSLMLGAATLILFILGQFLTIYVYNPYRPIQPLYVELGSQLQVWATPVLFAVGLLGLRTQYGKAVGKFGKNILLLGAIAGPVINMVGVYATSRVDWGWILLFTGNAVLLACLSIFGILAMRVKPLPRWNSLPLLAGIWYPALFVVTLTMQALGWEASPEPVFVAAVALQSLALGLLGYLLQADVQEEAVAYA